MNRIKTSIAAFFVYMTYKIIGFFYRDEIKDFQRQIAAAEKAHMAAIESSKKQMLNSIKTYHESLPLQDRQKLEYYASLQNELLKVFAKYCQQINEVNGIEMDGVKDLWIQTTLGLNQTIQNIFQIQNEAQIKKLIYQIQQECEILVASNQEILKPDGYRGPIGNA